MQQIIRAPKVKRASKKPKQKNRKTRVIDLRAHKTKTIGTKLCIVMRMLSDNRVLIFAYVSAIRGNLKHKKKWLRRERRKEEYWFRRICESIENEVPN